MPPHFLAQDRQRAVLAFRLFPLRRTHRRRPARVQRRLLPAPSRKAFDQRWLSFSGLVAQNSEQHTTENTCGSIHKLSLLCSKCAERCACSARSPPHWDKNAMGLELGLRRFQWSSRSLDFQDPSKLTSWWHAPTDSPLVLLVGDFCNCKIEVMRLEPAEEQ